MNKAPVTAEIDKAAPQSSCVSVPGAASLGPSVDVFACRVFNDDADNIPIRGEARVVCTISRNSHGTATRDPEFSEASQRADYLALDGVYLGLAGILLNGTKTRINNSPSVFQQLLRRVDGISGGVFFLGSREETLRKIEVRVARDYPRVYMGWYSPP